MNKEWVIEIARSLGMDAYVIYGIEEIGGKNRWYVGVTTLARLFTRIKEHRHAKLNRRRRQKYLYKWIQKKYRQGRSLGDFARIHVLDIVIGTNHDANDREIEIGMEKRALAPTGFNYVLGWYGGKQSEEHRRNASRAAIERYKDPEQRRLASEINNSPEVKEKNRNAVKAFWSTAEGKRKKKEASLKSWANPESRKRRVDASKKARNRPEVKENHRQKMKEYHANNKSKVRKYLKKGWQNRRRRALEKTVSLGI